MNGLVLYDGPSQINGEPVLLIATGIDQPTVNRKTGDMIQTWILPKSVAPEIAVATGEDAAICGSCPLRGIAQKLPNGEQINRYRGCYVFVGQAPQKIWDVRRHYAAVSVSKNDQVLIDALERLQPCSAADLAKETGRGTQSVATRLWHLRQMGLAVRSSRGIYEAVEQSP